MPQPVQLTFSLCTSSNVKSVHLVGSWDKYGRQLPLTASKPGSWKGTFRFQGSQALKLGSRYWYYYILDGYQVSHDPAKEYTVERTTGRKLNVLNLPGGPTINTNTAAPKTMSMSMSTSVSAAPKSTSYSSMGHSRRDSHDLPIGRALSPGRIVHPKPQKPYASQHLREADYELSPIDDLEERFGATRISPASYSWMRTPSSLSDASSASGELFSSPNSSSPSSCSSVGPVCRCERYGVTRDGRRVKLDCGGGRCGYSDSSSSGSDCGSSESEEEADRMMRVKMVARVPTKGGSNGGSIAISKAAVKPKFVTRAPPVRSRR